MKNLALGIALGASVVLAFGIAYAAVPGPDGKIQGCYDQFTGNLRVIDPQARTFFNPQQCYINEKAVSWGAGGPTGPSGVQGPSGPSGPMGATPTPRFYTVFSSVGINAAGSDDAESEVSCDTNDLLSGGSSRVGFNTSSGFALGSVREAPFGTNSFRVTASFDTAISPIPGDVFRVEAIAFCYDVEPFHVVAP